MHLGLIGGLRHRSRASRLRWLSRPTQRTLLLQQLHQIGLLLLDLIQRALAWRFIRPPAHQLGSMTESFSAEMVKTNFHHEHRLERLPFTRARGGPSTGPAWCVAGET